MFLRSLTMVVRPDPKKIIKQIIKAQNFDYQRAINEQRTQPFDLFLQKQNKCYPFHLSFLNQNKIIKNEINFKQAFNVVKAYLFTPTPIYLKLELNWPNVKINDNK